MKDSQTSRQVDAQGTTDQQVMRDMSVTPDNFVNYRNGKKYLLVSIIMLLSIFSFGQQAF